VTTCDKLSHFFITFSLYALVEKFLKNTLSCQLVTEIQGISRINIENKADSWTFSNK